MNDNIQSKWHEPLLVSEASPVASDRSSPRSNEGFADALGFNDPKRGWAIAIATIALWTLTHLLLQIGLTTAMSLAAWKLHYVYWTAWFIAHSIAFPRLRDGAMRRHRTYRRTFFLHIAPMISSTFALMGLPTALSLHGNAVTFNFPGFVAGIVLIASGVSVIASSTSVIGVAGAFFKNEYAASPDHLTSVGIYGRMRHPLFLGGILVSLGSALVCGDPTALACASVNISVLPIYVLLEDRRLCIVLGQSYVRYMHSVPAILLGRWL